MLYNNKTKTFKTKMSSQLNLNSTQETLGAKISKRQMKRNKLIESQLQNQHQLLNNPGRFNEKMENLLNGTSNKVQIFNDERSDS